MQYQWNKNLILLLFFVMSLPVLAQTENEKKQEHWKKKYSAEYKKTITDSLDFVGNLVDMNYGAACSATVRGAGVFLFKGSSADKRLKDTTIMVVIQCADVYRDFLFAGESYRLRVTPGRMKHWADFSWDKYRSYNKHYYLVEKSLERMD